MALSEVATLFLQYALVALFVLALVGAIAGFFFMLRSVMAFGSGIGSPTSGSSDSERVARMFDGPEYAADRRKLGISVLVFACSMAILAMFVLMKNHLAF